MTVQETQSAQPAQNLSETVNVDQARDKISRISGELNASFHERQTEIRGLLVGLVAREHVLLLGPPGTAKSALARELCSRIDPGTSGSATSPTSSASNGSGYFSWLLSRTSTPEELFGPISIKALEHDSYRRNTTGKLPEASIAFLDEIFKCNSAVLNGLLSVLNERLYYNDGAPQDVPLEMAVGASNELPADCEELGAVYDRFMLRFDVSYMREESSFEAMLNQATGPAASTEITADDLSSLREAAAEVDPAPLVPEITGLRRELSESGIHVSDRRYAKSIPLMAANAAINGRQALTAEDLELLADVLWTEPSQRKTVAKAVMERANPQLGKAQDLADEAEEIHATALAAGEEAATDAGTEANKKLRSVQNRLLELRDEAVGAGRSSARIDELLTRVGSMNQEVLKRCLGMDL